MNNLVNQVIAIYNFEKEQGFTNPDINLTCDYLANKNDLTFEELTILQESVKEYKFKQNLINKAYNDLDPEQASVIEDIVNFDNDFERMIHDVENSYPEYSNTFINYIYNN